MRIDVVSFSPSPDAVQEMRVQTNAYDAEFGHSGASFVNVSTRSGANDYTWHRLLVPPQQQAERQQLLR